MPAGLESFVCRPSRPPVCLADQRQIKNNHSLRSLRLCGEIKCLKD
ncbi:hypothetical protein D1AOALGA4SA_4683 [Olavius algarvensis Delta 1 endosymbiont]|nr:hypothetical protein D1AOALGA4SA_4683 [Olavius algarvensis Delta 1 endosymbiont]